MNRMKGYTRLVCLTALLVTTSLTGWVAPLATALAAPADAKTPPADQATSLQVEAGTDEVTLTWASGQSIATAGQIASVQDIPGDWQQVEIGDRKMPAQLVSLVVTADSAGSTGAGSTISEPTKSTTAAVPFSHKVQTAESTPWSGDIPYREMAVPQSLDGETFPDLAQKPNPALPQSPVVILREGYVRNLHVVVMAVTPLFEQNGSVRLATQIKANIQGARLLKANELLDQFDVNGAGQQPLRFLNASDANHTSAANILAVQAPSGPTNPLANANNVWKVRVKTRGMQLLPFSAFGSPMTWANVHVRYNGQDLSSYPADVNGNGTFDGGDFLLFYAPYVGDRFNAYDTYWVSVEGTPGQFIQGVTRPKTGPISTTGLERGLWQIRKNYDPKFPGSDGDHFFAGRVQAATVPVPLTPTPIGFSLTGALPVVAGNTLLTVSGAGLTGGWHNALIALGGSSGILRWSNTGAIPSPTATVTIASNPANVDGAFTLIQVYSPDPTAAAIDDVYLESVSWERPVSLNFASKGAIFRSFASGTFAYQLSNLPAGYFLYDITNPFTPTRLLVGDIPGNSPTIVFQSDPNHEFLMDGSNNRATDAVVEKHIPVDLTTHLNKNALYVAPTAYMSSLGPLLTLRQQQGYQPAAVSAEAIYDSWSFGQMSPKAIRDFLRYAASTWEVPPVGVTLVGDSTYDPFHYLFASTKNLNILPAYFLDVDPWIKETACESCFAQLNNDDPLDETGGTEQNPAFLPDLMIGRLPVKTGPDLVDLVSKIVGYETAPVSTPVSNWRSRFSFIADNYQNQNGSTDGSGNFAAFSEASVASQPTTSQIVRAYYDPCLDTIPATGQPRIPTQSAPACDLKAKGKPGFADHTAVSSQVINNMYNAGSGIMVYNGHGNQLIMSDETIFSGTMTLQLTNAGELPIVLQMTCLTSQFTYPASNYDESLTGNSLDELLLLKKDGGAIAVWGATGLGVAHGHDQLQRGFFNALWQPTIPVLAMSTPIGKLVLAGYQELALHGGCCQDTIQTFALLGDPLTRARVQVPAYGTFLPIIRK